MSEHFPNLPPPISSQGLADGPPPVLVETSSDREIEDDAGTFVLERRKRPETEMDMTPMVDVVFLLLIFFMVTAAFGMQKSIEMPAPESDQSSRQAPSPEDRERDVHVVVHVTGENRIFVEGEEATTSQELYALLREHVHRDAGREGRHLLVLADVDATHESVVRVLDAGSGVGMDSINLKTELNE